MKRVFFLLSLISPAAWLSMSLLPGCSITATRPTQEMADTSSAIKAAREVGAEDLASDYYRQATELFSRAKMEYKLKNFEMAQSFANRARRYAEQAEFLAIKGAGKRDPENRNIPPNEADLPPPGERIAPAKKPEEYATPTPIPVEDMAEQQQRANSQTAPNSAASPLSPPPGAGR